MNHQTADYYSFPIFSCLIILTPAVDGWMGVIITGYSLFYIIGCFYIHTVVVIKLFNQFISKDERRKLILIFPPREKKRILKPLQTESLLFKQT